MWLAILLHIREISGSDIDNENGYSYFHGFSSLSPRRCQSKAANIASASSS
jgi:hypothetical protein